MCATTNDALIYTEQDLDIAAPPEGLVLNNADAKYGIYGTDAVIEIRGDASISVADTAVYTKKNLISSGSLYTYGSGMQLISAQEGIEIAGSVKGENFSDAGYGIQNTRTGKIYIGGDAEIITTGRDIENYSNGGITVDGNVSVKGNNDVIVYASGGDLTIGGSIDAYNPGGEVLRAYSGKILVKGDADMSGCGAAIAISHKELEFCGDVTAKYVRDNPNGIGLYSMDDSVRIAGDVHVTGSCDTLIFASEDISIGGSVEGTNTSGRGLFSYNGNISIGKDADLTTKGNSLFLVFMNATLAIGGNANLTSTSGYAVLNINGSVRIDGDAKLSAAESGIITCGNDIEIGGSVEAENSRTNSLGFNSDRGSIIMKDGIWHVTAAQAALKAKSGIILPDTHEITIPAGGVVGTHDFSSNGSNVCYTVLDGESLAKDVQIEPKKAPAITLRSAAVAFTGMIQLRYSLIIPEEIRQDGGAYLTFEQNGETVKQVLLADGDERREETCFYISVPAPEYADDITIRAYDGAGNVLGMFSRTGTDYTDTGFTYSVKTYAEKMSTEGATEKMRKLAEALCDYGTAAQIYFKYGDYQDLAVNERALSVTATDLDAYKTKTSGKRPAGISGASITSTFEENNTLRIAFTLDGTRSVGAYTFQIDGESVKARKLSKTKYVLDVFNIAAPNLGKEHIFTVTDGTDNYTVTASIMSYARMCITNGTDGRKELGQTLYRYYVAASEYFGEMD